MQKRWSTEHLRGITALRVMKDNVLACTKFRFAFEVCVYFCFASKIIYTIFLDSYIYINIWYLCFIFLTSLCMPLLRPIHISTNDPITFLFMAEIFHCIYISHLYLFLYWGRFRLIPYLGYWEQTYGHQEEKWRSGMNWDWHIHTVDKIDNWWESTV